MFQHRLPFVTLLIALTFALWLAACNALVLEPRETTSPEQTKMSATTARNDTSTDEEYPAPETAKVVVEAAAGYPEPLAAGDVELPEGYPQPTPTQEIVYGPSFTITQPVFESDEQVFGVGPANVPIYLINVSTLGERLGETVIDKDGNFIFELKEPLPAQNTIGLKIGDLELVETDHGYTYEDFMYSPTYYERPFVGVMFDMVYIQAK